MFCRFQGKAGNLENDADTGLMYYGARYYSPGYRIFVQPDTMLPDPYNPQALNRYAYALDNPLKYTDPSGHAVETLIDFACLGYSISTFSEEPNLVNGAFLVWDTVATVIPILPASWILKAPAGIRFLRTLSDATRGSGWGAYAIYKGNTFLTENVLQTGINAEMYGITDNTFAIPFTGLSWGSNEINEFLEYTLGTDTFNNINHDGWYLKTDGTIVKDGKVLIEASSRSVNVLVWKNIQTGSITIEEIENLNNNENAGEDDDENE